MSRVTKTAGFRSIVIAGQKGGCGKTTIATHLATEGLLHGHRVLLVDLDPQQSCAKWYQRREALEPNLVVATATQLSGVLADARAGGFCWAIIDTPPHAAAEIRLAVSEADFVLVPTRPTILDFDAVEETVKIIRAHALVRPLHAAFVLSATPHSPTLVVEARAALAKSFADVPVLTQEIGQRAAYQHALTGGLAVGEYEPKSKAAAEISALFRWCNTHITPRLA